MSRHKSPLSNTYVFNFQGIFGEVGRGIQSLDDLNFYGTQYFLKKLQELKGSYNITVVDKFSPGTGVGHSMVSWKGNGIHEHDSAKWVEGCTWNLSPKNGIKFHSPNLKPIGVGLVLWNNNYLDVSNVVVFKVLRQVIRFLWCVDFSHWPKIFWGIWDLKS